MQSPYSNINRNNQMCPVDRQIESTMQHYRNAINTYERALAHLITTQPELLQQQDNWRSAFNRIAVDHRGLNAALREGIEDHRPLPWEIIHRGVAESGPLFATNHPAWMSRVAFFGRCYEVMGHEASQRGILQSAFSLESASNRPEKAAFTGLTLHHLGTYLAQVDRLQDADYHSGDNRRRALADDIMTGATKVFKSHQRRAKITGDMVAFEKGKKLFDSTVRRLEGLPPSEPG